MQLVTLVSFWQPACIEGTGEQTLSTCIPGDEADLFSLTVFYFWRCQNYTFLYCFSRLDYCNALLAGSLQVLLTKIQRLINCSAHLIFKVPKSAHITPFLYDLHWLPIGSQIQYKIALICFHIVSGTVPPYLSALLHLYSPSCSLRSAADAHIFRVPRMGRRTLGERSFQYLGPVLWNSLPVSVRHSSSLF